jgi:putative flippase GtrA
VSPQRARRLRAVRTDFARFFVAGGTAAAIHFALLHLFISVLGWEAVVSTSVGYIVAVTLSYLANYYWTFKATLPHRHAIPKFLLVAGTGLGLNALVFAGVKYGLGAHYFVAQAVATGLVMFWNFALQRAWSFAGERTAS